MITCKECEQTFDSAPSFHRHLRRHSLRIKEYYEKHYPMKCLQTGRKLVWKLGDSLKEYLARRFIDKEAMFCYFTDLKDKEYKAQVIMGYVSDSVSLHGFAPCQVEVGSLPMHPNLLILDKYLNYSKLCSDSGWKSRFDYSLDYSKLPTTLENKAEFTILIDTREQNPYRYYNSIRGKLDCGDYALGGALFNKICVERKSIADFWLTMSSAVRGVEETRFKRELLRARETGCYLIILCEHSLYELDKYKGYGYANASFICHNMRSLFREFSDCCQFVFCNNRQYSAGLLVEFLLAGQSVRRYDLQYFVDKRYPPFRDFDFSVEDLNKLL